MKRWMRFVNRKDWQPSSSSSYVCIKHFEEKYYKKVKNSNRYRLAKNMKSFTTIFDPKKVNNKNSVINLCSSVHGVIILKWSNNSQISHETSAPQQAGGFIIKYYFGISNITACRLTSRQSVSNHVSLWQDMRFLLAFP